MYILKLFILSIYCLHIAESYIEISIEESNKKLPTNLQNVFCLTDLNTVHLVANDTEIFDVFIEWLSYRGCLQKTVLLGAIDSTSMKLEHPGIIIFVVVSKQSINYFRQAVTSYQGSRSHNRFLVVFQFQLDLRVHVDIFKELALKTIHNIVVIVQDELDELLFRYNPCDEHFTLVVNDGSIGEEKLGDLFVRNRSELRGRNLTVSMYEQIDRAVLKTNGMPGYTGVDGLIADLLEDRMNATFIYTTPHEMFNGYKNSGAIGDLTLGHADITFNADSLALFLVNDTVDVTEPFELNDMCILVPTAGDEPIIWNLLRTLSKVTWVITLLSIVVMMLIYRWGQAIHKSIYSPNNYPYYEYSWMEVSTIIYQSFYGDAIKRIPTSMPFRILIIGWCIYSFLITNAFQAKLITSLVVPKGLSDIETIEELGQSNLKIIYPKALANHLKEYADDHTMSVLRDQLVEVENWSKFEAAIANKSATNAFVMMRFHAELVEKRSFDKAVGRPFYQTMKHSLLTFPRVYFLRLRSMYVDYVSELLRRFHETGFIVKWARHTDFINALHGNVIVDESENDEVDESNIKIVITTEHLQTSFYLLLVGLGVALLAFVGEHIYFRWNSGVIYSS